MIAPCKFKRGPLHGCERNVCIDQNVYEVAKLPRFEVVDCRYTRRYTARRAKVGRYVRTGRYEFTWKGYTGEKL